MADNEIDLEDLLQRTLDAIDKEIEAVRARPSHELLMDGRRKDNAPAERFYYEFETTNTSIQYAENIRADFGNEDEEELIVHPVELEDEKLLLDFPEDCGDFIDRVEVEWENDFVLRKLHAELEKIDPDDEERRKWLLRMVDPEDGARVDEEVDVLDDQRRNKAQHQAIEQALTRPMLYVWGPPGTGKTSTLGYIMANYLLQDKKVLFASNTNRAVDVGLLSVVDALQQIGKGQRIEDLTRLGEAALSGDTLDNLLFENQIDKLKRERREQAARLNETLQNYLKLQEEIDEAEQKGEEISEAVEMRCRMLGQQLDDEGGPGKVETRVDQLADVNEHVELSRRGLVATTLAKVCTSELMDEQTFDAVVVDEASMANLPYLLVLAVRARKHLVVVGDPMQLPPIAVNDDYKARDLLEQDIFAYVSGAKSPKDLFAWHDAHPTYTCFFNVQYRMKRDLARMISEAFYEGRLETAKPENGEPDSDEEGPSVHLIDTSRYGPRLTQDRSTERRGFQPVNEVHRYTVERIVERLVLKRAVPMKEIGIIVPFRHTVYDLRKHLSQNGYNEVEVGTIHTFQGREKQVIIFDTVMSGEGSPGRQRHFSVRPFDEQKNGLSVPRLLNVALSRSKERLVVVADMGHIERIYGDKFLGKLLRTIREYEEEGE